MYFCYFIIISPWKRLWPFICTNWNSPLSKDDLCQVWLKLARWFCRRRWKCEKFLMTTTTDNEDKLWSEKLTWAFGSGEVKRYWCGIYYVAHSLRKLIPHILFKKILDFSVQFRYSSLNKNVCQAFLWCMKIYLILLCDTQRTRTLSLSQKNNSKFGYFIT